MARKYDPDAPIRPIIKTPHRVPDSARSEPPAWRPPPSRRSELFDRLAWASLGFALGAAVVAFLLWR